MINTSAVDAVRVVSMLQPPPLGEVADVGDLAANW
jgi:hypothetical protein